MKKRNRREIFLGLLGLPLILKSGSLPRSTVARIPADGKAQILQRGLAAAGIDLKTALTPRDTVGIKLNCLAGKHLSPRPALVESLVSLLVKSGLSADRIILFDRSDRELDRAGYPLNRTRSGYKVMGVNQDYEDEVTDAGPVGTFFCRILTRKITKLINLCVLKDHDLSGVSVGMKNFFGLINNPNKYHANNCSPYVAHVAAHPAVKDRLFLTVVDAAVAQYHGGPAYVPRYAWEENGVYLSTDPVAVDRIGWKVIEEKRKEKGLPTLAEEKRTPAYIHDAAGLSLGTNRLDRIRLLDLS